MTVDYGSHGRAWRDRVSRFGPERSVLNAKRKTPESRAEFDRIQFGAVLPILRSQRRESDRSILDYGCGIGRWSCILGTMGTVLAVDPTPEILASAPRDTPSVSYLPLGCGRIPCWPRAVDVVFSCLVLNAITDPEMLAETVAEFDRALKPGGLLFLVDLTWRHQVESTWSVMRSADEYAELFRDVAPLSVLGSYEDLGEIHSIMAGRKPE